MQWLQSRLVSHGDVGAAFEKQPQNALVARACCEHERGDSVRCGGIEVDIEVREQFDNVHAAKGCGSVYGHRAVVGRGGSKSGTIHAHAIVRYLLK